MRRVRLAGFLAAVAATWIGGTPARASDPGWQRLAPAAAPAPVVTAVGARFVTAESLASRTGLAYQDGGSFVLLSSPDSRVRLYPGSNRIVIDGEELQLKGQIFRSGPSVLLPVPGATFIETRVRGERGRIAAVRRESQRPLVPPPPAPPRGTVRATAPRATPAAAPRAAPGVPGPEPGWIPPTQERAWRWIILHHSDDTSGNAAKYHKQHLAQGWENGLGYNFVIGNGTLSGDGQVEVGHRWTQQIQGAHAKTPDNCFNELGIGITLVGDFEHGSARPTAAQMTALVRLCRFLMARYNISAEDVRGHCDCKPTACPGKNFPWAELRARLASGR